MSDPDFSRTCSTCVSLVEPQPGGEPLCARAKMRTCASERLSAVPWKCGPHAQFHQSEPVHGGAASALPPEQQERSRRNNSREAWAAKDGGWAV
jgi:hypothetical protein